MAIDLTPEEVTEYIENFLSGDGESYDWDDFTSITIKDSFLDWIRNECCDVYDRYPSGSETVYCSDEGAEYMKTLVEKVVKYKNQIQK